MFVKAAVVPARPEAVSPGASGVRRQARGRARMESILDAAEQLVAAVGYDEMTTNAVAARAGISPGSLYQFFGNKAELLTGLLDRYVAQLDAFWDGQFTPEAVTEPTAGGEARRARGRHPAGGARAGSR